ncbi:MAG: hypothetical protein VW891_13170, partial [Novosphingobium sp.]
MAEEGTLACLADAATAALLNEPRNEPMYVNIEKLKPPPSLAGKIVHALSPSGIVRVRADEGGNGADVEYLIKLSDLLADIAASKGGLEMYNSYCSRQKKRHEQTVTEWMSKCHLLVETCDNASGFKHVRKDKHGKFFPDIRVPLYWGSFSCFCVKLGMAELGAWGDARTAALCANVYQALITKMMNENMPASVFFREIRNVFRDSICDKIEVPFKHYIWSLEHRAKYNREMLETAVNEHITLHSEEIKAIQKNLGLFLVKSTRTGSGYAWVSPAPHGGFRCTHPLIDVSGAYAAEWATAEMAALVGVCKCGQERMQEVNSAAATSSSAPAPAPALAPAPPLVLTHAVNNPYVAVNPKESYIFNTSLITFVEVKKLVDARIELSSNQAIEVAEKFRIPLRRADAAKDGCQYKWVHRRPNGAYRSQMKKPNNEKPPIKYIGQWDNPEMASLACNIYAFENYPETHDNADDNAAIRNAILANQHLSGGVVAQS